MKAPFSIGLLGLLGFCAYGLAATQEPMGEGQPLHWRLLYGGLATLAVSFLAWIWWPRTGRADSESATQMGPAGLRLASGAADLTLSVLILCLCPFAWILKDGLGPEATSSAGLAAVSKAFWTFYAGPLTLAALALSFLLRRRLATAGGREPRRS